MLLFFDLISILFKLLIVSVFSHVLLKLVTICSNVGFNSVTLLFADCSFLHELIKVLLELLLKCFYLSHLSLHFYEVLLFSLKLSLALHFHFLASITILEKFLTRCLILADFLLKFILLLGQLRDIILGSVDLTIKLADIV